MPFTRNVEWARKGETLPPHPPPIKNLEISTSYTLMNTLMNPASTLELKDQLLPLGDR